MRRDIGPARGGSGLLLVVVIGWGIVLFWGFSAYAHYDHDHAQGRHWYKHSSGSAADNPTDAITDWLSSLGAYTVCNGPGPLQEHPMGPLYGGVWCSTTETVDWNWCAHHSNSSGNCAAGQSHVSFDERHCGYSEFFDGETCSVRADQCAVGANQQIVWVSNERPHGVNIPDEDLFGDFGVFRGCSLLLQSSTDHGDGTYSVTYVVSGDFHLDHDLAQNTLTLRASRNASYDAARENIVDCVPPLVEQGDPTPISDWGQSGDCAEEPPPPPSSGGPDNEGGDDTDPDPTPRPDPTETNAGNEGVEERLDYILDEQFNQTDLLGAIDSELDEIDSNTERTANAVEDMLDEMTDDQVTGGGTCASPPICSGDPIQCAILEIEWEQWCGFENDMAGFDATASEGAAETAGIDTVAVDSEVSGLQGTTGWLTDRTCPVMTPVVVMGQSIQWSFQGICEAFGILSYLILGFASFAAYRVVSGVDI